MSKRLQVTLLPNWADCSADNPEGPPTFVRTDSDDAGALQVSLMAEYKGGEVPNPTHADLIDLARGHGKNSKAGKLVETASGACAMGKYGTAVFRSKEYPRIQLWYLSNGFDFVLATHVCSTTPDADEVAEAQQIVGMVEVAEKSRHRAGKRPR